jgi:hypothetical protein
MLAAMPDRLFREWMEFFAHNPFGPRHEDLRAGLLASLLYAPHRKSGAPQLGPEDFFPSLRMEPPRRTPEELAGKMMAFARGINARMGREPESNGDRADVP